MSWNPYYLSGLNNGAQLPWSPTVSGNDLIPLYSQQSGIPMYATMSTFAAYIQTLLNPANYFLDVYATPLTGQTVNCPSNSTNQWVILTPVGALANLALVLPGLGFAIEGQVVQLVSTQTISALSVTAPGCTVNGSVAVFGADNPLSYRYNQVLNIWFRVS